MNKFIIAIILIVGLFVLAVASAHDTSYCQNETFNVSGSSNLSYIIKTIEKYSYYEWHDNETVEWMKSLEDNMAFIGNDSIVIMNSYDAGKIPPEPGITDVWIYNYFNASIIENHTLGDKLPTVYYVENVTFINQEIVGNGLA